MSEGPPTSKRWATPRFTPTAQPGPLPTRLGPLVREYRRRTGMSQVQLARRSGIDPAYINRLERSSDASSMMLSRSVVLRIWGTLQAEEFGSIGEQDRERLLVAAGLVPEVIRRAGGWDAYLKRVRAALASAYGDVNQALTGIDDGGDA